MARVNISALNITLTATNKGLASALRDSSDRLRRFDGDVGRMSDGFGRLRGSIARLGTAFAALKLGQFTGGFLKDAARLASEAETAEVQFRVMLKSAEAARKLLAEIEGFAIATPFKLDELRDASRQLLAFGVAQDDILPTLKSIGDIAAGSGSRLSDLAEIYGRVAVSNRLAGEEINRLQDRGIPILRLLAEQLGQDEAAVRKLASEGKVGFAELQRAFADLTSSGGVYQNQMAALSQTSAGLWSSFTDDVDALKREIGQGMIPAMQDWLQITSELVKAGRDIDLASAVKEIVSLVTAAVKAVAGFLEFARSGVLAAAREIVTELNRIPEAIDQYAGTDLAQYGRTFAEEFDAASKRLGDSGAKFWGLMPEDRFDKPEQTKQFDGLERIINGTQQQANQLGQTVATAANASAAAANSVGQAADAINGAGVAITDDGGGAGGGGGGGGVGAIRRGSMEDIRQRFSYEQPTSEFANKVREVARGGRAADVAPGGGGGTSAMQKIAANTAMIKELVSLAKSSDAALQTIAAKDPITVMQMDGV